MTKKHLNNVIYRVRDEGLDYTFRSYSDWKDVEDKEFHKLRLNYLKAAEDLEK